MRLKSLPTALSLALALTFSHFCLADSRKVQVDLSAAGTANCYIVSSSGYYKFKVSAKGSSSKPLGGTPASADVLWEASGSRTALKTGSLIKASSLSVSDGHVSFEVAKPFKDGNALIAVRDASGVILWSWHIWMCTGFDPQATAQEYNNGAGLVMDRNLGATSAVIGDEKAFGLLYQWGRKDPFTDGKCTLAEASTVISGTDNLGYSITHPTTFIYGTAWPFDWYCVDPAYLNDGLWSEEKTEYDPCPSGWKVPRGDTKGLWCKAFGNTYYDWSYANDWDDKGKGMNYSSTHNKMGSAPSIWYPAAGSRDNLSGNLQGKGDHGYYWSSSPFGSYSHCLCFFYFNSTFPYCHLTRAYGMSVRCQREQ